MRLALAALLALASQGEVPGAQEAASSPFRCPEGTVRLGASPPAGYEVWCERPEEPPERRREGPERTYYDDGGLAKASEWKAGRLHGPFVEWYRNGRPARAGEYRDGEREGVWKVFFENGPLEEECGYQGGERHGRFASYFADGRRRVEGRFCHGLQCATWTSWDDEGRVVGSTEYEDIHATP